MKRFSNYNWLICLLNTFYLKNVLFLMSSLLSLSFPFKCYTEFFIVSHHLSFTDWIPLMSFILLGLSCNVVARSRSLFCYITGLPGSVLLLIQILTGLMGGTIQGWFQTWSLSGCARNNHKHWWLCIQGFFSEEPMCYWVSVLSVCPILFPFSLHSPKSTVSTLFSQFIDI